jgi:hypothetical protein
VAESLGLKRFGSIGAIAGTFNTLGARARRGHCIVTLICGFSDHSQQIENDQD